MSADEATVFAVVAGALALFAAGRWRYDLVALLALLALTLTGVVPAGESFRGFGHPAVITVAPVLIISRALQETGAIDVLAGPLARLGAGPMLNIAPAYEHHQRHRPTLFLKPERSATVPWSVRGRRSWRPVATVSATTGGWACRCRLWW